jgi:hypothetical protein
MAAALPDHWDVAAELDGIPKTLFCMNKNGLAPDIFVPNPRRLSETRLARENTSQAPFVLFPAAIEVVDQEPA